jgi:tetratricopeptide (TPR) repeat protein
VAQPALSGRLPAFSTDYFVARPETGHGLDGSTGSYDGAAAAGGQDEPEVTVLIGPSGSGKSHLAAAWLSAASRTQPTDLQVWLDASHRSAVLAGYAQAANDLALTGRGAPAGASAERFLEWMNHGAGRWHAVFDDVTDPAGLLGLWPTGSGGKVLVTCHPSADSADLSAIASQARVRQLGALSPREALGYLAARLYEARDDRAGAVDLAADLGYLPLALKLATSMVAGSSMTCYDYRRRLASRCRDLEAFTSAGSPSSLPAALAPGSGNGHVSPVDAAVSLALDWVDHFTGAGLARAVLALVSLVAPSGVPAHLLVSASGCRFVSSNVRAVAVDPQQVMAAIGALAQASLVHLDGAPTQPLVSVHPAVQATVRRLMPAAVYEAAARAAADAITEVLPLVKDKPAMALAVADCAAGLAAAAGEVLWRPERHAVFASVDACLNDVGLTSAAVDFWQGLLATDEARQRADPAQVLLIRDSLAAACDADGRSGEAIEITLANLTDRESELGPDHPDTLTTLASLAGYYRSAGTLDSAISACERAVAGREWVLGAGHAETLAARGQLASTLHLSGQLDAAIAMYQQNLAERERQLGPVHPDVLTEQASLARAYQAARRFNEAIAIFRKVLAAWEQNLGAAHPDTLSACASLAFAYRSAGRMKEAIPCYRQTVAGREQVLGADHPDTLTALANLASCYHAASRMKEALPLYERVLVGRERVQGPDHPDTLTARGNLAGGYHSAGRLADALPLYERTVADFERVLGRDHPSTLTSLGNLAQGYYMARRQTDAIAVFERALADATRALGPEHTLTQTIADNLAALARLPPAEHEAAFVRPSLPGHGQPCDQPKCDQLSILATITPR